MKRILFLILIISIAACKEKAVHTSNPEVIVPFDPISEINDFKSYDRVHTLLQGSWANTLDPSSVIIFKEGTTTNMYQEVIATANAAYTINTSCAMTVATTSTEAYRYLNTPKENSECYFIQTLDQETLVLKYLKGDITLTFKRLEE